MAAMPTSPIPLTLLTGFLGSGKTTLLNRLLRDPALAGSAVLINEAGEVGLDQLIVERSNDEVVLLESGCVCCSLNGDLAQALAELLERHETGRIRELSRVLIETTGLADPAPVIRTLIREPSLARHFRLDGVVATLPAEPGRLARYPEARRQIALADRIVLTKCDLADGEAIAAAFAEAQALNPGAAISRGDALPCAQELLAAPDPRPRFVPAGAERHAPGIETHLLRFDEPVDLDDFASGIDLLLKAAGKRILRIKGLYRVEADARPHLLQAVSEMRYPDSVLPAWPDADHSSRLVFITQDLPRPSLVQAFEALTGIAA